jgi:DDE superfamily endonuclease
VKDIDLKDLVFLDERGVQLRLSRTHARAEPEERAYDFKPVYRGTKASVIGAITDSKVIAEMTIEDSMDAAAFEVYISKCLVPIKIAMNLINPNPLRNWFAHCCYCPL